MISPKGVLPRHVLVGFCFILSLSACVTTPESGRKAFIVTSESEEMHLGEQAYQEVLQKERPSTNQRWNEILQRVGRRIAAVANKPEYRWQFRLIESKEKNAFCLPGGKVAFYTGIFTPAQNEAALAAVMGHEVAHATARHAGQRMTLALGKQAGLGALSQILGGGTSDNRKLLLAALGIGAEVGAVLPFSRANESEADQIGLVYMARAGYDPEEAPKFWGRFASEGGAPTFLSTHPNSGDRMAALQAQLPSVAAEYSRSPRYGQGDKL
jgi:predicted Zn-dependent protease